MTRYHRRSSVRRKRKRRHSTLFETLEPRHLLASNPVYLAPSGTMFIRGTNSHDVVQVPERNNNVIVQWHQHQQRFAANQVDQIRFRARGGDDTFVDNTNIPSIVFGGWGLMVSLLL